MTVVTIRENGTTRSDLADELSHHFTVRSVELDDVGTVNNENDDLVVDVDLKLVSNIRALQKSLDVMKRFKQRIFVVDKTARAGLHQALALGATSVLFRPVSMKELRRQLSPGSANGASVAAPPTSVAVAAQGATAFAKLFASVVSGASVDLTQVDTVGAEIASKLADEGLTSWLSTVREHHDGTFQHCLLVTGIATDFGLKLGLRDADIRRLSTGAMLHDIGKARIPLDILDKPARLTPDEFAVMQLHPIIGYDALIGQPGVTDEMLRVVRHHHEYLDGSGYPDGIGGRDIPDLVRMMTISDIFAALVEDRRYKKPMPAETAYQVLLDMRGKLEAPLVVAFKEVAYGLK